MVRWDHVVRARKKSASVTRPPPLSDPPPAILRSPPPPATWLSSGIRRRRLRIEFEFWCVLPWKSPVSATTVVRSLSWPNELMIFVFFDWGSLMVAVRIYACARLCVEMKNYGVSLARVIRKHWYLVASYDSAVERSDWPLDREFPARQRKIRAREAGPRRMKRRSKSDDRLANRSLKTRAKVRFARAVRCDFFKPGMKWRDNEMAIEAV